MKQGRVVAHQALKKRSFKALSDNAFTNQQLCIFQTFLANSEEQRDDLSNAIDLWDNSPRFSVTRKQQEALREPGGYLPITTIIFKYKGNDFKAEIRPARLHVLDEKGNQTGNTIEYYPSAREEIIEHALRKLALEPLNGFYDKTQFRSGCRFTVYQLRKHLKEQGHDFKHNQIVEALHILAYSSIELSGKVNDMIIEGNNNSYINLLNYVTKDSLAKDRNSKWLIQFHPLITNSIQKVTYRQFNYKRLMDCKTQLARWLINQLVLKYTNAAMINDFKMHYITIKRDSGLLTGYKLERQAIAELDSAWEELRTDLGVIATLKKDVEYGKRNKIMNVIYTITPTSKFVAEQKAANKRLNIALESSDLKDNVPS